MLTSPFDIVFSVTLSSLARAHIVGTTIPEMVRILTIMVIAWAVSADI